jgi:transposase-like protein
MDVKKYSDEEKLKIIQEAKATGSVLAVARKYNVSDVSLYKWIRTISPKSQTEQLLKIKNLEKQLADSLLENAILKDLVKKTVQVWSSEDKPLMNTSPGDILKRR